MTAEVGVLNRSGVALAADSAVSVGVAPDKVLTSADKLFQLSLHAPVGIMVYGNSSLLNLPWETIIKEYRGELARRTFPKLTDYKERFRNRMSGGFLKTWFRTRLRRQDSFGNMPASQTP